jgi:hypothetical protein
MATMAAVVMLVSLQGCSSDPDRISATPDSVSYQYDGDDLTRVNAKASEYCNGVGKAVALRNVSHVEDRNVAIFDCQ